MRLCIVPRWGAGPDQEWYPWLRAQSAVTERFAEIIDPIIENPGVPTVASWIAGLTEACGAAELENTWFVGHSVGCQGILRYLASLPEGVRVAGCLLVAGWWDLDEPWDTIRQWLYPPGDSETPALDVARARAAGGDFHVLISDNDPYTADWQTTKRHWEERVGATVRVIPGAKHFNGSDAPVVAEALAELVK